MYLLETAHSSFCSRRMAPTSRVMAASLGKIPTTLVRRLTSAWSRSIGFVGVQFLAVLPGEAHVGEDVVLGFVRENCQLGHLGPELVGDLAPLDLRAVGVLLGEGGGDEGGDDAPALAAGMGQQVGGRSARGSAAMWRRGSGSRRPSGPCGRRRSPASRRAARAGPASAGTRSRRSRPPTRRSPCPGPRGGLGRCRPQPRSPRPRRCVRSGAPSRRWRRATDRASRPPAVDRGSR